MKNKFWICIYFLAIQIVASAQKPIIKWGEQDKITTGFHSIVTDDKGQLIKISNTVRGGTVMVKGLNIDPMKLTPVLTLIDGKFNEVKSRTFYDEETLYGNSEFLKLKNYLYIRSSKYDKETKTAEHVAQAVNLTTLEPQGKQISFGRFAAQKTGSYVGRIKTGVSFEVSTDSSHLLVFAQAPNETKKKEKFYMGVFDNNVTKKWERTIELPYQDNQVRIHDFFVTNAGEVCIIIKLYEGEVKKETIHEDGEKVPGYSTKLLIYSNANDNAKEYFIDINKKYVQNINLITDVDNNLTLFGTYKEKEYGYVSGFFTTTLEKNTGKVTLSKIEAFTQELVAAIAKDDQGSKKEKDPGISSFFRYKEHLVRDNGSIDYIFEYFKAQRLSITSGSSSMNEREQFEYEYGDILNINISKTGKSTVTRIPKFQQFSSISNLGLPLGISFKAMAYKNKLCIFYNDEAENLERELDKSPIRVTNIKKTKFVMATIDEKGGLSREALYSNKDDIDAITLIEHSKSIGKNKISLYALRVGVFTRPKDALGSLELR